MKGAILYVSSNREHPAFEARVLETVLASKALLLLPVTQAPVAQVPIGIVVGDVGVSGFNMFRQVQIGLRVLRDSGIDYVVSCEADTFYPPDYFDFVPLRLDVCYRNDNVYVMPQNRSFFWRKPEGATHAQVVGCKFYLDTLTRLFDGAPEWAPEEKNFPKERWGLADVFAADQIQHWSSPSPVVQVKTSRSMRHYTHSDRIDVHELPYWGTGRAFRQKYYDIGERH